MSHEERGKGWLSELPPVSETDLDSAILSPRFCISEQHGTQEQKSRLLDLNKTVQMSETYFPPWDRLFRRFNAAPSRQR